MKTTADFLSVLWSVGLPLRTHQDPRSAIGHIASRDRRTIARQKQEDDGELRYQLCALIFLIGQLPHQGPADAGIRADADTLADLLVTDLTASSAELRKKIPILLKLGDIWGDHASR